MVCAHQSFLGWTLRLPTWLNAPFWLLPYGSYEMDYHLIQEVWYGWLLWEYCTEGIKPSLLIVITSCLILLAIGCIGGCWEAFMLEYCALLLCSLVGSLAWLFLAGTDVSYLHVTVQTCIGGKGVVLPLVSYTFSCQWCGPLGLCPSTALCICQFGPRDWSRKCQGESYCFCQHSPCQDRDLHAVHSWYLSFFLLSIRVLLGYGPIDIDTAITHAWVSDCCCKGGKHTLLLSIGILCKNSATIWYDEGTSKVEPRRSLWI